MTTAPNEGNCSFQRKVTSATALVDATGRVIGWSQAAEELLGWRAEEVLDRPVGVILPPGGGLPRSETGELDTTVQFRDHVGHDRQLSIRIQVMRGVPDREDRLVIMSDPDEGVLPGVNRSLLDGLLAHAPIGMAVMDTDLRYVWFNDALVRISGAAGRLGRTVSAVFPADRAAAGEAVMRRVLETGVPLIDFEYRGPILADPMGDHRYSASFFRLEDGHGIPVGLCYLVTDVTERWRRHQRELMLSRARACGKQLDPVAAAQELADICVPDFADLVTVDLDDAVLRGDEIAGVSSQDSVGLRHAAHKAVGGVCADSLQGVGDAVVYAPSSRAARCLTGKEGILEASLDAATSAWATGVPGRAKMIDEQRFHSSIMVPLCAGGASFGIITFLRAADQEPYSPEDVSFAEEFAAQGSSALAAAHRFTQERRISLSLQRTLLPGRLGGDEAAEIAWRYFPASQEAGVGGDWVDAISLSGGRTALVIGDVVGHGVNAAAAMGRLRAAVHMLAAMDLPPDELLAHLDDFVTRLCEEQPSRKDCTEGASSLSGALGASCMYAIYDPVARTCTVARAGHPAPVIARPDGTAFVPDLPAGPPLGAGSVPFESVEIPCPDGSLLAFFTDGLVEDRTRGIDEGVARLRSVLSRGEAPLEELCDDAVNALLTHPLSDDAALILARTISIPPSDVATWDIPDDTSAVREARVLANQRLEQWGLGELQFSTELIVSELVTNAIRYGATPIRLRLLRHHGVLTCEVTDGSSTSPRLRHARTMEEGGRGLFLVAQVSRRWGYRYTGSGKSIWVEQDLP